MGTGLCDPPVSRSLHGETTVWGSCTELTEDIAGLLWSPPNKPFNCLQIKGASVQYVLVVTPYHMLSLNIRTSYPLQSRICSACHALLHGPWDPREDALTVSQGSATYRARTQLFSHKLPAKIWQVTSFENLMQKYFRSSLPSSEVHIMLHPCNCNKSVPRLQQEPRAVAATCKRSYIHMSLQIQPRYKSACW